MFLQIVYMYNLILLIILYSYTSTSSQYSRSSFWYTFKTFFPPRTLNAVLYHTDLGIITTVLFNAVCYGHLRRKYTLRSNSDGFSLLSNGSKNSV